MHEQKNLFLAIILSIGIIIVFQFLFPQESLYKQEKVEKEISEQVINQNDITSIDQLDYQDKQIIKTKEEIVTKDRRVKISSNSISGSINLKGAIIDDLNLLKYYETIDNVKNINLLSPNGTKNPYFVEIGWQEIKKNENQIELPNIETLWTSSSNILTPNSPIKLTWENNQSVIFNIYISIDDDYMFDITQEVVNLTERELNIFPYRLIKRINKPDTINFFILHEGLIGILNNELIEKDYDDLADDCLNTSTKKNAYCDNESVGGWMGFTDKYWLTVLIPDQSEKINIDYRFVDKEYENFLAGYAGNIIKVNPNSSIQYTGNMFAGAKVVKILNKYENELNIIRFNDAVDWGWFSFLTKPIFYAINWFYQKVGNFGIAIIGFTILMRIVLFPLAQASFKSMAKMKKLQPEMQNLKERFGNDKQKMQQELMSLYKKEGANPIAGCLPIFLQIPIFFALYKTLFVTIEMYQAPFYLWIKDLSAPDPAGILILFGLFKWDVPEILSIINIGVLPIIMGLSMYIQQKLNPAPTDPVQAKIFTFLPIIFTFILAGFAAGLVLYWSVNNILSIAQQWVIQRKILKQ